MGSRVKSWRHRIVEWLIPSAFADEFEIKEDLTVDGTGGTLKNPNVEVKGNVGVAKDVYLHEGMVAAPFGGIGRYENLLNYSEDLTQTSAWTRSGLDATTPAALDAAGPTGLANSAVTMKNGAAANGALAQTVTTTVTLPYTLSVWLKAGTSTSAQLELTTNGTGATTDTSALTLTTSWQRVSLTKSTGAGTSPTTVTATLKNTGAAATTILLWGAQLEQAASPGVYVKATNSAVAAGRGVVNNGTPISSGGGFALIETKRITAATTSVTFSGLDGDTDEVYYLTFRLVKPAGAAERFTWRPNGLTTNLTSDRHYHGSNVTHARDSWSELLISDMGSTTLAVLAGSMTIEAKTGVARSYITNFMHFESNVTHGIEVGGVWNETTTNLTSIDIVSSVANGIGANSVISLYKVKRTSSGAGGGSGDVLTTATNTFTATTASPILIKPSAAPTANTKLLDMQATGAGTTNFSVDAEGDVTANSLTLTVALPDAQLATISTAGKVSGAALTSLASVPSAAGVLPAANTPLGATIETGEITDGTIATADVADSAVTSVKIADGTIATADVADGAITWAKLNGTTNLTLDAAAADLARTLTITNAAADTATAGTPDLKLIVKGGAGQGATTEVLDVQNSAASSLFAVEAGGNVGIGTATPAQKLSVAGTVESTSGGFKFPDASTQTTAVSTSSGFSVDTGGTLTNGLVSYWKLDEASGSLVGDAARFNDGSAINGPSIVAGKLGNARSFDGTDDYVSTANESNFDFAGPLTISAWVKVTTDTTTYRMIVIKGSSGAHPIPFQLRVNPSEQVEFQQSQGGASVTDITGAAATAALTLNTWYHVVATNDGTTARVYLNGTSAASDTTPATSPSLDDEPVWMGAAVDGYYFTGAIDEVGIWSRALTAAEITDLYNAGAVNAYKASTAIGGWTDDGTVVRLSTGSDAVGIGTTSPVATAILDLTSTTKGLLAPRMTTTQRDAITSPAAGLLLYNTTTNAYNVYNGTSWAALGGSAGAVGTADSPTWTGTHTFTATTASPILIKPSSAPTANTKLLDMQATGVGTTNFSVDAEGDVLANSLTLTTPLAVAQGGTGTATGSLTGTGALTFTAGGTNQNVTLTPSGTGYTILNGNVGLGTTAPTAKLDVSGTKNGTLAAIHVGNWTAVGDYGDLDLINTNTSDTVVGRIRALADTTPSYASALAFFTNPGGAAGTTPTEKMRILANGNLGIGTASPTAKLDVTGDIRTTGTASTFAAGTYGDLRLRDQSWGIGVVNDATNGDYLRLRYADSGATQDFRITQFNGTTDTTRLMLDQSGNVGIGTASPGAKLDVAGGDVALQTAQKVILDSNDTGDASNSYLVHDAANDRVSLYVDGIELVRINK